MSTQLRLVEPPEPSPRRRPRSATPRAATGRIQPIRARGDGAAAAAGTGRRVVHWADWRLDARTRTVGRAGVARARRALAAAPDRLSRAS